MIFGLSKVITFTHPELLAAHRSSSQQQLVRAARGILLSPSSSRSHVCLLDLLLLSSSSPAPPGRESEFNEDVGFILVQLFSFCIYSVAGQGQRRGTEGAIEGVTLRPPPGL